METQTPVDFFLFGIKLYNLSFDFFPHQHVSTNLHVAVNHDVFFRMISNNRALMSVIKFEMYNEHYYDNN